MLHEAEATEPEDKESGDRERTPVPVEVLLDRLMEHTVAAILMDNKHMTAKRS